MIFGPTILETLHSSGSNFCHVLNIPEAVGVFLSITQYCNMQVIFLLSGCTRPMQSTIYSCEPIMILFKSILGSWNNSVCIQIMLWVLWPKSNNQFLVGTTDFSLLFPPQYLKQLWGLTQVLFVQDQGLFFFPPCQSYHGVKPTTYT